MKILKDKRIKTEKEGFKRGVRFAAEIADTRTPSSNCPYTLITQDNVNSLQTIREASSKVKKWPQWKIANIRLAFSEPFGPLEKSSLNERTDNG